MNTFEKETLMPDSKLYELALSEKKHREDRRDDINNYYTSLFAAIIAAIPFIEKVTGAIIDQHHSSYLVKLSLTALSSIGLILAITWALSLTYTLAYLKSLERLITNIEMKYNQPFLTF